MLEAARDNPEALVAGSGPLTINEVQREPRLQLAVKRAIDRERIPGQFLLTGSANLLPMKRVSESLAGRATYLTLWRLTRREQLGLARCGVWDELFALETEEWPKFLAAQPATSEDWFALARRGGFPSPAVQLERS